MRYDVSRIICIGGGNNIQLIPFVCNLQYLQYSINHYNLDCEVAIIPLTMDTLKKGDPWWASTFPNLIHGTSFYNDLIPFMFITQLLPMKLTF
jgi:hypothetical protein